MNAKPPTQKSFYLIWLVLVILHFVILGSAYLNLKFSNTPIILTLAVFQMLLILLYFMELRYRAKLFWLFAAIGFFWLALQWILTASDYLTRRWH